MANQGDVIRVNSAEVLSAKMKRGPYGEYVGILVSDLTQGKVWFRTTADFAYRVDRGDKLTASVEVTGLGDGIIFGKKPSGVTVCKAEILQGYN